MDKHIWVDVQTLRHDCRNVGQLSKRRCRQRSHPVDPNRHHLIIIAFFGKGPQDETFFDEYSKALEKDIVFKLTWLAP